MLDVLRKNYNSFSFHPKGSLFVVCHWFDARIFIFQRQRLRVLSKHGSEIWVSHESAPMCSLRKMLDSTKSDSEHQVQVLSSRTRKPMGTNYISYWIPSTYSESLDKSLKISITAKWLRTHDHLRTKMKRHIPQKSSLRTLEMWLLKYKLRKSTQRMKLKSENY